LFGIHFVSGQNSWEGMRLSTKKMPNLETEFEPVEMKREGLRLAFQTWNGAWKPSRVAIYQPAMKLPSISLTGGLRTWFIRSRRLWLLYHQKLAAPLQA
jgi:hypothetical protein